MKYTFYILILSISLQSFAQSELSLYGFKLGDPIKNAKNTDLKQKGYEEYEGSQIYRFETPHKNDFSMTFVDGELVFMEEDYLYNNDYLTSLENFEFEKTKFIDVKNKFNSKGFIYADRNAGRAGELFYTLVCYKIKNTDHVLVFGSTLPLDDLENIKSQEELWSKISLSAIILAQENYLDSIWGDDKKLPDNDNYKIDLNKI